MAKKPQLLTGVIANGASLSAAINTNFGNNTPIALIMPAAWTAASITFQVSYDGTTFAELYTVQVISTVATSVTSLTFGSTEYVVLTPAAATIIKLDPTLFAGVQAIKIQSGVSGTLVNQGAARTMTLVCV